jgi:hypothetical protein
MVIVSRSEYALRRASALASVAAAGNKEEFCCIPVADQPGGHELDA